MSDEKTIIAEAGNFTILNSPKKQTPCLVQYSGSKLGRRYPLVDTQVIVGREQDQVQIAILETTVSRQHARFNISSENVTIEDLGSSNGTFVNDKRTQGRVELRDGDMIRLGTVLLKYFAHDNVDNIINDKIYRLATIDAGTQIFNKAYLMDALDQEFKFSRTYGRDMSIIYYDLDKFKSVNDTYGHNAGDFILKESAAVVKKWLRKEDIFGRFGGEEFVIILPNTDRRIAADLADRIRQKHETHEFILELDEAGRKRKVRHQQTISMGVSQLTSEFKSSKDLLESADKKLYHSKQSGRNRVTT